MSWIATRLIRSTEQFHNIWAMLLLPGKSQRARENDKHDSHIAAKISSSIFVFNSIRFDSIPPNPIRIASHSDGCFAGQSPNNTQIMGKLLSNPKRKKKITKTSNQKRREPLSAGAHITYLINSALIIQLQLDRISVA